MERRLRLEDAYNKLPFIGMVTRGEDLENRSFFKKGNVVDEQRFIFNNLFLPQMAKATDFVNKRAVEQAIIEVVDLEETALDEKDPVHYKRDMSGNNTYPYPKTLAGALQPKTSNSQLLKNQLSYLGLALLGLLY